MKGRRLSALKIAATYIGTVVGAGFATGQEILQFFTRFGVNGLWGILISTALFILFGVIIMEIGYSVAASSHLDIICTTGGKRFTSVMDVLISFFLFASLTAMMAGTGALFTQQFGLPGVLGSLIMAAVTAVTVLGGFSGVVNSISGVVPFLMVSVIGISLCSLQGNPPQLQQALTGAENPIIGGWLRAGVLYASYNIIMSAAVLGPLGACAKDRRAIRAGALLGGGGLGLASVMICLAMSGYSGRIEGLEVPFAYIAGGVASIVQQAFAAVLVAEVYTTAVGALYGFCARVADSRLPISRGMTVFGITAAAFLASMLGFSNIVKYMYPLIGYCGMVLLIKLMYTKIKQQAPRIYGFRTRKPT